MKFCTIATSEIAGRFRRTIESLRATGNTETVVCYVPEGYEPPLTAGTDAVKVVRTRNWWKNLAGARGRINTPALCKPEILLDSRWMNGETVLYFDAADVLFFSDPDSFFAWPADKAVAAYPFQNRTFTIAGGVCTDLASHYNSGVIGFRSCEETRKIAALWLAFLNHAVAFDLHNRNSHRPLAGDQISLGAALSYHRQDVFDIPHEWNYRGSTNVRKCKIRDNRTAIGRNGLPVMIAHATGGGTFPSKIQQLALSSAAEPTKAPPTSVTVVIPAYRAGEFIRECVESIPPEWPVLIGLDGCTETASGIPDRDGMRTFMFPEKTGPYLIRNTLAAIAETAEWLLFLDADDYLLRPDEIDFSMPICRLPFLDFKYPAKRRRLKKYGRMKYAHGCFAVDRGFFLRTNGFHPWPCSADTTWRNLNDEGNFAVAASPVFARRRHLASLTGNPETGMGSDWRKPYLDRRQNEVAPDKLHTAKYIERKG